MNQDKLAETLARIDERLLADEGLRSSINAETILRLHSRRRARTRSIAAGSLAFVTILSAVVFRSVRVREDDGSASRTFPIVSSEGASPKAPEVPAGINSKPDFELATVSNPAMNFELELVRESIAENLVKLARLGKDGGMPESDWRENLDFVLKNYPGTIAAESARIEFGTESESTTN